MNEKFISKKYQVKREIASGGMGTIYLATDTKLGRDVAIKMLHPQYSGEPAFAQRFLREAWAMAKLDHPNVIRIWSVEEEENSHCIVMEYFPGHDLKQIIRQRGPLPIAEAISLTTQIVQGLAYAHYMGIIHRDIKPANIMVDQEGKVKITDFGIAAAFSESSLTIDGTVMGTPEYMAPEQARAEPVGSHTDLYSVGILMYELLTGQTPYKGIPAHSLVAKLAFGEENPSLNFPSHIPLELQDLIVQLTQKKVEDRLKDINEILSILKAQAALSHEPQPDLDETTLFQPAETASTRNISTSTQTIEQSRTVPTKTQTKIRSTDSPKQPQPEETLATSLEEKPKNTPQARMVFIGVIGVLALVIMALLIVSQWPAEDLSIPPSLSPGETVGQSATPDKVQATIENIQQISQNIQSMQKDIHKEFDSFSLTIQSLQEKILNKNIPSKYSDAQKWLNNTKKEVKALALHKEKIEDSQELMLKKNQKVFTTSIQNGEELFQQDLTQDQKKLLYEAIANLKKNQRTLEATTTSHRQDTQNLISKLKDGMKKAEETIVAKKKLPSGQSIPTSPAKTPTQLAEPKIETPSSPKATGQNTQEIDKKEQQIRDLAQRATQLTSRIQNVHKQSFEKYENLNKQMFTYAEKINSLKPLEKNEEFGQTVTNLQAPLETLQKAIEEYLEKHDQQFQNFAEEQTAILDALNNFTETPLKPSFKKQASQILQTIKANQKVLGNFKKINWVELDEKFDRSFLTFNKIKKSVAQKKSSGSGPAQISKNADALKKILDDFASAYENRDILHLTLTTSMSESRTRNLDLMFKNYKTIETHTKIISTSETQAKAKIFIDKLIDNEGKAVTPNFIISETAITIPKKDGKWGKIHW